MSEMKCAVARDLLSLYAEDLVSPETAAELEAHLAVCADCRETLRRMRTEVSVRPAAPAASEKKVTRYVTALRLWYLLCPFAAFVLAYLGWRTALTRYSYTMLVIGIVGVSSQFLAGATLGGVDYDQVRRQQMSEKRARRAWGRHYVPPIQIALPALVTAAVLLIDSVVRAFAPIASPLMFWAPAALIALWVALHFLNKHLPKE